MKTDRCVLSRSLGCASSFSICLSLALLWLAAEARCLAASPAEIAEELKELPAAVLSDEQRAAAVDVVRADLRRRLQEANDRGSADWKAIQNRDKWIAFRDSHVKKLRESLGQLPRVAGPLDVRVTGGFRGDGFRVENLIFSNRGLWSTANLYLPDGPVQSKKPMPGILICHSHHRPKEQGELQDMGMTWARAGCAVLVMDQLGHGERRQHSFASAADFPEEFRPSRQDYYFRYDSSLQLYLAGESLMGWMASDLMRGVDLLLARGDVDPAKIALLGAVAGGGDPAAVTAAIDDRIAVAAPFNFGGPQPETRFPLPDDAETSFNYAGSGSWESTRNLRRSAADGFLPWVIVGSIAPRKLIFGHEFNWDRPRDPVWKRLETIYGYFDQPDSLAYTHGRGELSGQAPEASHCTNIGPLHRQRIHAAFQRWFGIAVSEANEHSQNVDADKLRCLTDATRAEVQPKKLHEALWSMASEQISAARERRMKLPPQERRETLCRELAAVLGKIEPGKPVMDGLAVGALPLTNGGTASKVVLTVDGGIRLPLLLLVPKASGEVKPPVVIGVSQAGKQAFLQDRAETIAALLNKGIAVCLPDLRGTGETRGDSDRGPDGGDTSRSATEMMLGGTMIGSRLRDLRTVILAVRQREDIDAKRIGIWGDSFVEPNPLDATCEMPRRVDGRPRQAEPGGAFLAMLAGLYESDVRAFEAGGGLAEFQSVLRSPYVNVPHDAIVPGLLTVADLPDIAASLAPRPLRLSRCVDGWNRRLTAEEVQAAYPHAAQIYRVAQAAENFVVEDDAPDPAEAAAWWLAALRE